MNKIFNFKNSLFYLGVRNKSTLLVLLLASSLIIAQNRKLDYKFQALINNSFSGKASDVQPTPSVFKLDVKSVKSKTGKTNDLYSCIIYTENANLLKDKGFNIQSVYPTFVTALVSVEDLKALQELNEVKYVESPDVLQAHNDIALGTTGASLLHEGRVNNTPLKGKGILVGVFDSGIDWKHPDFRNPNNPNESRILRIWDQTLTPIGSETSPTGFSYGVEYTQAQINADLANSSSSFVREVDTNGHGTHVAGTAAGNGSALSTKKYMGLAPEADIIFVKGGNDSFPTTNTVDSFTYFRNVATALNRPIVVNYSIGGQFGPHDGTRPHELAADSFTNSGTGRLVVISAGNDNGTNLHRRENIAVGETKTISFSVGANTSATDLFAFRLYANDNTDVTAVATSPTGESLTVTPGQLRALVVSNNGFKLNVDNNVEVPNNDRYVEIYVNRNGTNSESSAGIWTLSITNNGTNPIITDGWLYYKNKDVTTTLVGGDSNFLVGSPGNATNAITAASYVGKLGWFSNNTSSPGGYSYSTATQETISTFSATGPRRDNVLKPDITATGQAVISAMSSGSLAASSSDNIDGTYYRKNQGTSMAAPVVTGALALLLQAKPNVTLSEAKNAIYNTASSDANNTGTVPNNRWGYGKLDIFRAVSSLVDCSTQQRETILYEEPYPSALDAGVSLSNGNRIAVKFTPTTTGKIGGIYFSTSTTFETITSFVIEVRNNNGGVPGNVIATKSISPDAIAKFAWQYFDLSDLNVNVTSGSDYFLVVTASGGNWSLRRENSSVDNRSYTSGDGNTWTQVTAGDYRIRSVVYSSVAAKTSLVANAGSDSKSIVDNQPYLLSTKCDLIGNITPNGSSPVRGMLSAKVWVDSNNTGNYVKRHFEILPSANSNTSTVKVTLYFTQAEFNEYNNATSSTNKLPINSSDNTGKANIKIKKFLSTSSDNTGNPNSYSGTATEIDPVDSDIIWNSTNNYWEVSFNTTGLGGFFLTTQNNLSTTESKNGIRIFPNPTKDFINVNGLSRTAKAQIFDISGKLIQELVLQKGENKIDVSSFVKGVYLIKYSLDDKEFSSKFIKK